MSVSGLCIYYWIVRYYCVFSSFLSLLHLTLSPLAAAILFTIIAIFSVLAYFGYRSRIPLASLLLQVVMDVSKHHKSVFTVAFAALFLQATLSVYVLYLFNCHHLPS